MPSRQVLVWGEAQNQSPKSAMKQNNKLTHKCKEQSHETSIHITYNQQKVLTYEQIATKTYVIMFGAVT